MDSYLGQLGTLGLLVTMRKILCFILCMDQLISLALLPFSIKQLELSSLALQWLPYLVLGKTLQSSQFSSLE